MTLTGQPARVGDCVGEITTPPTAVLGDVDFMLIVPTVPDASQFTTEYAEVLSGYTIDSFCMVLKFDTPNGFKFHGED